MVMEGGKSLPKDDWHRKYYWDLRKVAWPVPVMYQKERR